MMKWGYSSAGRAPALHAGGQRFDPAYLHHLSSLSKFIHLVYLTMITEKFYQLFFKNWKQAENKRFSRESLSRQNRKVKRGN